MNEVTPPGNLPHVPEHMQHCYQRNGLTWLDIMYPSREQVEALRDHYHFHPLHAEDVLSRMQRPKIDDSDDPPYLFLVLHFPVFNAVTRLSTISEVDIFVGPDYIVTTHDGHLKPLIRLAQNNADERVQSKLMGRGSGFLLYRVVEALINYCFPMLYRLDEKLDQIEENMFKGDTRAMVEELSFIRRDIISLRRIIRPNLPVLRSLAGREREFLRLDEDAYFGDLVDGLTRIWDMLEEHKEIIEGLDATLFSLTSHRINMEMKTFTLISIIILPMTLLASILGMNVVIPGQDHPLSLVISLVIMLALGGAMYLFFRHKNWI